MRLVSQNHHPLTRRIAATPTVANCFFAILADAGRVAPAIARMYESGVLCRFLPEFAGIRCLVQREIFHRYTVDQHTLLSLRELDTLFSPANATNPTTAPYRDALLETGEPALLYLALLLHDIGKRHGVARHAETGAADAEKILRRLHVRPAARDEVIALVRDHLAMSAFWQTNDLDDPANLRTFAARAGTAHHLRYLYALTYCDARATSPDLWNDYKNSLHRQLYRGALAHLEPPTTTAAARRHSIETALADTIERDELAAHLQHVPDRYLEQCDAAEIALHIQLVSRKLRTLTSATGGGAAAPAIHWADAPHSGVSTVTLATRDAEGLFYKLAGAFVAAGFDILRARGFTRTDGIAIDIFQVQATTPLSPASAVLPIYGKGTPHATALSPQQVLCFPFTGREHPAPPPPPCRPHSRQAKAPLFIASAVLPVYGKGTPHATASTVPPPPPPGKSHRQPEATTAPAPAPPCSRFARAADEALVHLRDFEPEIRRRAAAAEAARPRRERQMRAVVPARPQVTVHSEEHRHRVVVTVKAPDTTGLLFFLARLFYRHRFNITFAGINTETGVATDTFYLEPFTGEPDKTPAQLAALTTALESATW
jgi:UTP:GlnB (protein PII) uridylyltransferase